MMENNNLNILNQMPQNNLMPNNQVQTMNNMPMVLFLCNHSRCNNLYKVNTTDIKVPINSLNK